MKEPTASYILKGFTHKTGFRVFAFERTSKDRERAQFSVKADLGLIQKYKIAVQDLPLLCRGLLEQHDHVEQRRSFVYTESDMSQHAEAIAAGIAAKQKKYAPRKLPTQNPESGDRFRASSSGQTE